MPGAAVEIRDLRIVHTSSRRDTVAVDGLTLDMGRGQVTSFLGPNGAGKTSTISVCEGFRRPTSGTVRVLGLDPVSDASDLRPRVGVMLQDGGAWLGVRAGEMLRYVAGMHANPLDTSELLERLGLSAHQRTTWRHLSGGQKQRLSLAAAVVGRPELVFLDEPTAGLDPQSRRATWDLVEDLRAAGTSVVLTTHHMDEAHRLSDTVHIIDRGRLVASGTPDELTLGSEKRRLVVETGPDDDLAPLDAAMPELGRRTSSPEGVHRFEAPGTPETLARVADWCARNHVELRAVRAERATLEERFLELTGRELR